MRKENTKELLAEETSTQEGKSFRASTKELSNTCGTVKQPSNINLVSTPNGSNINFQWGSMISVESSNIDKIGHFYHNEPEDNVDTGVIAVTFKSNPQKVYLYEDQDYAQFQRLKGAASIGAWVNDNLKKNHVPVIAHEL